jgi:hypothetical protein
MRLRVRSKARLTLQVVMVVAMIAATVAILPAQPGDLIANLVLGQLDFTHDGVDIVNGFSFQNIGENDGQRQFNGIYNGFTFGVDKGDVAVDKSVTPNRIYVVDNGNSRVLGWSTLTAYTSGQAASIVFGQPDFNSYQCSDGTGVNDQYGIGPESLCHPQGVGVDASGDVVIADTQNSRVLFYPNPYASCSSFPCVAQPATLVFGQGPDGSNLYTSQYMADIELDGMFYLVPGSDFPTGYTLSNPRVWRSTAPAIST